MFQNAKKRKDRLLLALLLHFYRIFFLPSTKLWVASKHVLQNAELFGNHVIFNVTKSCYTCILACFFFFVNSFFDRKEKNGKLFFFSFQIATNYAWEKFYNNTKRTALALPKERNDQFCSAKNAKNGRLPSFTMKI